MVESKFLKNPLASYASCSSVSEDRLGEVSEDRSAVVGKNGWCFIYEGTNNYRGAYHDETLAPLGDQWAKIIEQRQNLCDGLNVRFVQLIVPNKATIIPENYPEPLAEGISTVLKRLLDVSTSENLLCPVEDMRQPHLKEALFRRNDSHLTPAGNAMLSELLLTSIGIEIGEDCYIDTNLTEHIGDLGSKFACPIAEKLFAPKFDAGLLDQKAIEKSHETIVNGFNGTRQSFHNPRAPIKKRLLVFGNSFFEKLPSWGLSPIFAAMFETFHFVWTPDFDEELAKAIRPDFIICQTCERFLNKIPKN